MEYDEKPQSDSPGEQDGFADDAKRKKIDGSKPKAKNKRKRPREDDGDGEGKRGVCYLSRVPPRMDPSHVRQMLSQYGDIQRIYLAPEDPVGQVQQKQSGGFQGKGFSEGWVEFSKKSVAKKVAATLNGEQIGGKRRSAFFYDIWNIKYLCKFKWDDLIGELAMKKREREEKLKLEISAAKRERDFYISKVEQSRALKFMRERREKKQNAEGKTSDSGLETKVIRQFPQNRPVAADAVQMRPALSKDLLAGQPNLFGNVRSKKDNDSESKYDSEGRLKCGKFIELF